VVLMRRSQNADTRTAFVSSDQSSIRRSSRKAAQSKVVMQSGSSAFLLLDGGHVHIKLAVICLESGVVGQTIRVASRGHEHTYMAEVCNDGLLRGAL